MGEDTTENYLTTTQGDFTESSSTVEMTEDQDQFSNFLSSSVEFTTDLISSYVEVSSDPSSAAKIDFKKSNEINFEQNVPKHWETAHLFSPIDYILFAVMLGLSALIGIYFGFISKKKQNNTTEYLLGGKKMNFFPIAASLIARYLF